MENTLTPEQKKQINSWVAQRDAILIDIGKQKTEQEQLIVSNKGLAASNTDLSDRIQQSIGRLTEIEEKEKEREGLVRKEIVDLAAEKSVLQTEVTSLKGEINNLSEGKQALFDEIGKLMKVHGTVFNNTTDLEKIITDIVNKCSGNAREVSEILKLVEEKCKEILTLSTINIESHTQVLDQIPRLFVELRKKSLEREIIHKHKKNE